MSKPLMIEKYANQPLVPGSFDTYVILDLETTTSKVAEARIVSLALVPFLFLKTEKKWLSAGQGYYEFNPGVPIEKAAAECHGIQVPKRESPTFETLAGQIAYTLATATVVVGWNMAEFILPILNNEMKRAGIAMPGNFRVVDLRSAHAERVKDPLKVAGGYWTAAEPNPAAFHLDNFAQNGKAANDSRLMTYILFGIVQAEEVESPDELITVEMIDPDGKIIKKDDRHWFTFGKYDRKKSGSPSLEELVTHDHGYLDWLGGNTNFSEEFRRTLKQLVERLQESSYKRNMPPAADENDDYSVSSSPGIPKD